MPRKLKTQREKILQVVQEVRNGDILEYQCVVDCEKKCKYSQKKNFVAGNFKRHLKTSHPEALKELDLGEEEPPEKQFKVALKQRSKLIVDLNKQTAYLGLLQLVTINNLPFRFIEWVGSRNLISPVLFSCGKFWNRRTVATYVSQAAAAVRIMIVEEMKGKYISLKIDSASRRGRAIFGINAQFADADGNVQIRHLAVQEMHIKQSKENLSDIVLKELESFGVDINQIFSVAHDNGANMCATVRLLQSLNKPASDDEAPLSSMLPAEFAMLAEYDIGEELIADELTEIENIEDSADEAALSDLEDNNDANDDFENELDGKADITIDADGVDEPEILDSIRCGVHTAQLVANDVIKLYKNRLTQINKISLKMHRKANRDLFILHKIALPPKVNETRWGVWYILLRYLQVLRTKPFLAILQNQDPSLDLSKHWRFIDRFCNAFEPLYILTLKLQKNHVPLSDFYADWLICQAELHMKYKQENKIAAKLLICMETRIEKLRTSMAFKTCLYLDPRFNFSGSRRLSEIDKKEAQEYLITLNNRLDRMEGSEEVPNAECSEADKRGFVDDYVMDLFKEGYDDTTLSSATKNSAHEALLFDLIKLESREKVFIAADNTLSGQNNQTQPTTSAAQSTPKDPSRFDIMKYWKQRKFSNPRLYRLAMIVLSAPSTQVTVERLFSQLKYILTDYRGQLCGVSIKDIMLLKMNTDLLSEVVSTLIERDII